MMQSTVDIARQARTAARANLLHAMVTLRRLDEGDAHGKEHRFAQQRVVDAHAALSEAEVRFELVQLGMGEEVA
ncbi:hypothetical protein JCM16814_08090 [Desulfobaculum senezii]